ncbi:light harvesting complex protein, partial [Nannochloropsis gaditana]
AQVDKKSLAYREVMEAGATAPFGFFDPIGLSTGKTFKELKKWRESEVKHGRVAMLAVVGVLLQEVFAPFYNPETGSSDPGPAIFHFQELEALNPFLFVFLILGIAIVESFTISKGWESPEEMRAGESTPCQAFAFYPFSFSPEVSRFLGCQVPVDSLCMRVEFSAIGVGGCGAPALSRRFRSRRVGERMSPHKLPMLFSSLQAATRSRVSETRTWPATWSSTPSAWLLRRTWTRSSTSVPRSSTTVAWP